MNYYLLHGTYVIIGLILGMKMDIISRICYMSKNKKVLINKSYRVNSSKEHIRNHQPRDTDLKTY